MFKVVNEIRLVGTKVYCELYATTKEEVTEEATISGLPVGRELSSGSYGYTQAGDLFIYDDDTGFKFVGEEEPEPSALTLSRPLLGGLKQSSDGILDEDFDDDILDDDPEER